MNQMEMLQGPRWTYPQWAYRAGFSAGSGLSRFVTARAHLIRLAESDGIPQVAPILVAFDGTPEELKRRLGKSVWKRVHHSATTHNAWRASIKLSTRLDFGTIINIPTGALPEISGMCRANSATAVTLAAGFASNRKEMRDAVMLCSHIRRMGGSVNPAWSMRRLHEEHDRLSYEWAHRKASSEQWAPSWEIEIDGYRFTRLVSDADFSAEGMAMRHCIASYASRARSGEEVAFRIEGPERASVSFGRHGIEIKGPRNQSVSRVTRDAAFKMWEAFNGRTECARSVNVETGVETEMPTATKSTAYATK